MKIAQVKRRVITNEPDMRCIIDYSVIHYSDLNESQRSQIICVCIILCFLMRKYIVSIIMNYMPI
jgi:hypothetical protein